MCITPMIIFKKIPGKVTSGETIQVPCGKCPTCYGKRISGWSFRLMQQHKKADSAWVITLTYAERYVPLSTQGTMVLDKRDVQLFLKRLRKAHDKIKSSSKCRNKKICYFAVGEYGTRTNRPHYHIILFNARVELIQPAWGLGDIHYMPVNEATVGYTLKYMQKEKKNKPIIEWKKSKHCGKYQVITPRNDRTPEFQLSSKGIGKSYINWESVQWHHAKPQERMYLQVEGGKKVSMPRYYKDVIYADEMKSAVSAYAKEQTKKAEVKELREIKRNPNYQRNKIENQKDAFKKMHKKAIQNRSKI